LTKRFDEREVLRQVSFEIRRGEKVGMIGPNGTGKTTILRIAAGLEPATSGTVELGPGVRLGYFAQHAEEALDLDRTVLDEVLGSRPLSPEQVRTLLGRFLFSGETAYKRIGQLSGGERRRVALAKLVLDRPDVLLLDEPTTHLDLPSLEALEGALRAFPGAMLLVSHDRYLLDHVASRLLVLGGGTVVEAAGPYHAYRAALAAREAASQPDVRERRPAPRPAAPPAAVRPTPPSDRTRGETRSAGSRGAAPNASELVARIAALETEQTDLSRLMGDPELYRDADRARGTVERYEEVCAALEALYGELEGVEEQAGA
ncbi:MAG TPA: ATP-binding cassette domain-containing protein, partial [bacterium]|nr:ATP-binding cassette domain-containing protein [bacterium]